jgi:SnoaL-like domain
MKDRDTKLQELIDRQEIWQVLQRYGRGLDRLDVELARSCYFDDAIEDHGTFVGSPDQFIEWANQTTRAFLSTHHNVMNHHCDLDGDDAYAETYYLFIGVAERAPHLLSMGRYVDHFQRRQGEWRIANRVAIIEKNFDLPDSQLYALETVPGAAERPRSKRDRQDVSYQRPLKPRQPPR